MFKFLLILFIVIYLLGQITKWILTNWIRKMSNQQMNTNDYNQQKEGEVTINIEKPNTNKRFEDDGEYVDYEEVDD
jgi:uncharacterized protein involved in cysteine biosynthesis